MTALGFAVLDVRPERHAAAPTLLARLRVTAAADEVVHAIALRAQVRIEPQRRGYTAADKEALVDLFGAADRWGQSVKPFLWMHTTAMVPGFTESTEVELPLPCSYDMEVASSTYLHAVAGGGGRPEDTAGPDGAGREVPLSFLFNGTVFTRGETGFSVRQVPWDAEARYRLPARVWRDLMDHYFPNSGWLRLDRDTLGRLARFKSARALPTWEQAFAMLLKEAGEGDR